MNAVATPTTRLRPDVRREQLLDAALRVLGERGYDGLRVTSVARAAGVTRPVVYTVFPTIEDLQVALLEREATRLFQRVVASMQPHKPDGEPMEQWLDSFDRLLAAVEEDCATWTLVLHPPPSTPPALLRRMDAVRAQLAKMIRELVGGALRRRGITEELADSELFSLMAVDVFERCARLLLKDPVLYSRARMVEFSRCFFIAAEAPLRAPRKEAL